MSTMKIKKGDTVKVIAGKDLGTEGKVLSVDVKNHKVLVEGVNKITKHAKPPGVASLTEATITSPICAYLLVEPPITRMQSNSFAPVLSATFSLLSC